MISVPLSKASSDIAAVAAILPALVPVALETAATMRTVYFVDRGPLHKIRTIFPPCRAAGIRAKSPGLAALPVVELRTAVAAGGVPLRRFRQPCPAAECLDGAFRYIHPVGYIRIPLPILAQVADGFFLYVSHLRFSFH